MSLNLQDIDYVVIGSILFASLVVGFLEHRLGNTGHQFIELGGPLVLFMGAYFLYQSSRSWQRSIARYLEIIIVGITFFAVSWIFNILRTDFKMAQVLGSYAEFLFGFFHPFAVGGVILIAYGIFLIDKEGGFQFEKV